MKIPTTDKPTTDKRTSTLFAVCTHSTQYTGFKMKWKDFYTVSIPTIWSANPYWVHSFMPGISFNWSHSLQFFFSLFTCFSSLGYSYVYCTHTAESYNSFVFFFCVIHKINNVMSSIFSGILMLNVEMVSIV